MKSQKPITINEDFICKHCGAHNRKAAKTCRNHCTECLYSQHVDESVPGDRESACHGLMEPASIITSPKGQQIIHVCLNCGASKPNKVAPDDNTDTIATIMAKQNLQNLPQ